MNHKWELHIFFCDGEWFVEVFEDGDMIEDAGGFDTYDAAASHGAAIMEMS
jgi:hypothetical protein